MSVLVNNDEVNEALVHAAQEMLTRGGRPRSERVCYYRTPKHTVSGDRHVQAGWIGWDQTQQNIQLQKIGRGYIPLPKYGFIEEKKREDAPDGPFELYGPWGPLLADPDGMRELPAEQIIAYHWYDEMKLKASLNGRIPPTLRTRDGMVMWPQLKGMSLKIYVCPECANKSFNEPIHLARHLRIWHDYDRQDIIAFGREHGVDFRVEITRDGKPFRGYTFDDAEAYEEIESEFEAASTPEFSMEVAKPSRSRKD